jgi:hypothetical protein
MLLRFAVILLCLSAVHVAGCQPHASSRVGTAEPVGLQIQRADSTLKEARFSLLLDFERDSDRVFVDARDGRTSIDRARAHTGGSSLRLDPGQQGGSIHLSPLLSGRGLPSSWTLLGLYVQAPQRGRLNLVLQRRGSPIAVSAVPLMAGQWTSAMVDLSPLIEQSGGEAVTEGLVLQLDSGGTTLWIDDLVLIDNSRVLVEDSSKGVSDHWSIVQRGHQVIGEARGRFTFSVPMEHPSGVSWQLHEANKMRSRFLSSDGSRHLVFYADGRAFRDGNYEPVGRPARDLRELASAHASPAELTVSPELGRVLRQTPGDANNDGYNEIRGAYQLQAAGARLEVQIVPRTVPILWPVLEVHGLPAGKLLVTLEGRLVEKLVRMDDGNVLIIPPVRVDRPTTLNIRVQ